VTTTWLDPRGAAARGLRALVLTSVAVAVAGSVHTYLDGCLDLSGLLLSLGLCWPGAVLVMGRRRRLPLLLGWVVGAQVVTHVVLTLTCGAAQTTPGRVVLGHALAVLVTTAVVARVDAALWAADSVRRALARLLLPLATAAPVVPRVAELPSVPRPLRPGRRVSPRVLRGPPSGLVPLTS
jgi:hypothetical protein